MDIEFDEAVRQFGQVRKFVVKIFFFIFFFFFFFIVIILIFTL